MASSTDQEDVCIISDICDDDEIKIVGEVANHSLEDHKCDLCSQGQFLIDKLLRYGGLINDKYKYVCEKCDMNFVSKSQLKNHSAKCSGPVPTVNKKKDTSHIKIQEPKICSVCHTIFKNQGGLTRHMQSKHSGLTYECGICKAVFSNFKKFNCHCFQHEQNRHREYVCTVCNKSFLQKKSLLRHNKCHKDASSP